MHFVAYLLDRYSRSKKKNPKAKLRGYEPSTWVPAEYQLNGVSLPASQLAYSPCPTFRDLYFERVEGIPRPQTWQRVVGRAVDATYRRVHEAAHQYCHSTRARDFDLMKHLAEKGPGLVEDVLREELRGIDVIKPQPPNSREQRRLREDLEKIVRFEARLIGSTIERELARLPSQRPSEIFDQHFDFNVQFSLDSRRHGISSPATPDFFYHQALVGDIKVGQWQSYYEYTMVTYALAYEEEQESDMDLGAILLVECLASRPVPSHHGSRIEFLDDARRKRFLMVRSRKLEIIADEKDPGRAERQDDCQSDCPYRDRCWGDSSNG